MKKRIIRRRIGMVFMMVIAASIGCGIAYGVSEIRHTNEKLRLVTDIQRAYETNNEQVKKTAYMEGYNEAETDIYRSMTYQPTITHEYVYSTDTETAKLYQLDYTLADGKVINVDTKEVYGD